MKFSDRIGADCRSRGGPACGSVLDDENGLRRLHAIEGAAYSGERVGLDAETLQERDEEQG